VVQPYRATSRCEAMRPAGYMMQMGLSHASKDTIRVPPKRQKSSLEKSSYALLTQPLSCLAVGASTLPESLLLHLHGRGKAGSGLCRQHNYLPQIGNDLPRRMPLLTFSSPIGSKAEPQRESLCSGQTTPAILMYTEWSY
jgi:hypothetical protein